MHDSSCVRVRLVFAEMVYAMLLSNRSILLGETLLEQEVLLDAPPWNWVVCCGVRSFPGIQQTSGSCLWSTAD